MQYIRIAVGIPDNVIEMTPQLENRTDIRDVLKNRVAGLTVAETGGDQ
jgi:hypothetical protein